MHKMKRKRLKSCESGKTVFSPASFPAGDLEARCLMISFENYSHSILSDAHTGWPKNLIMAWLMLDTKEVWHG